MLQYIGYHCKHTQHCKMCLWDDIQGYQSELTNRLWKCWTTLSIITVHWAQLHSPRQTECLKMQRQRPPLYPNGQASASLQTTVTRVTAPHRLSWAAESNTGDPQQTWRVRMMKRNLTLSVILNRWSKADRRWISMGVGLRLTLVAGCKSSWLPSRCKCSELHRDCAFWSAALVFE